MRVFSVDAKQQKSAKHAVLVAAQSKQAAKHKPVLGVLGDS